MKKALISIKGKPFMTDGDDEGFELMTDGEYSWDNGVSSFSYMESELTGLGGMLTIFDVEQDRVVLRRGDGSDTEMVFSESEKHHFLYETPYGLITLGIDTHSIKKNMRDDGGCLEIQYDIEVDNVAVSQNLFKINITTQ